jgi:hypothetical protein
MESTTSDTSTGTPEQFFGRRSALTLGAGLLAGLILMAALCLYDQSRRGMLEQIAEPTAVGDTRFVAPPPPVGTAGTQTLGLTWHGKPLIGNDRVKARDNRMLRVEKDDSGAYSIYRLDEPAKKGGSNKARDDYFVKTAIDEFLRVTSPQ